MAATLNNTAITAGESVQIALQVENAGEQDSTFQADLIANSETVDSKPVTVKLGENKIMVFEYRFDDPGEYEIAVADTSLGTLTVTAATDDGTVKVRPNDDDDRNNLVEVTDATVLADWVKNGYETTVSATVVNTADRTATRTLTVTVDDQPVATETVTLQPNERDVVAIKFVAVEGTVAVEGVDAGRISVSERYGAVGTETGDAAGNSGQEFEFGIFEFTVVGMIFISIAMILASALFSRASADDA